MMQSSTANIESLLQQSCERYFFLPALTLTSDRAINIVRSYHSLESLKEGIDKQEIAPSGVIHFKDGVAIFVFSYQNKEELSAFAKQQFEPASSSNNMPANANQVFKNPRMEYMPFLSHFHSNNHPRPAMGNPAAFKDLIHDLEKKPSTKKLSAICKKLKTDLRFLSKIMSNMRYNPYTYLEISPAENDKIRKLWFFRHPDSIGWSLLAYRLIHDKNNVLEKEKYCFRPPH